MRALKPAVSAETDGGIIRSHCDPDARVGGGCLPLRRSDIGPAFQQLRRHADGDFRQGQVERRKWNAEIGEVVVGDGSHGVFKLRAPDAHIHKLRPYGFELGLGLFHVGGRGHAALQDGAA